MRIVETQAENKKNRAVFVLCDAAHVFAETLPIPLSDNFITRS